jgi:hypothetical protein
MSDLTEETRNKLKMGVILFLIAFIVIYGLFMFVKYSTPKTEGQESRKNTVVFAQPKLTFFSTEQTLNLYPDRITIHEPYLIVVRPESWKSEIYNMQTKKKEKVVNEIILDYFNGDSVYNKQGFETYYNNKSLKILCDQAFIKSSTEILCVSRMDESKQNNKLISVNPKDLSQKELYRSQKVITAIYSDKETLYIAEYDFTAQKASIIVNNMSSSVADLINVIYFMNNKLYAGSFKSQRNNNVESYYEVTTSDKKVSAKLVQRGKIVFYN